LGLKKFPGKILKIILTSDARISSSILLNSLNKGLQNDRIEIVYGGKVPTPLNLFAFYHDNFDISLQITASHNPKEYNGLKISDKIGSVCGEELQEISKICQKLSKEELSINQNFSQENFILYNFSLQYFTMLQKIINKVFGSHNDRKIKEAQLSLDKVILEEKNISKLSESELKKQFIAWKKTLSDNPELVDELLPVVFAGVKCITKFLYGKSFPVGDGMEEWKMKHFFDVQIIGGIILHQGSIAEMKTGEGKTLTCTLPIILNALTGRGAHVITVNDYLAERDAEWMKPLYEFCGLSVGVIISGTNNEARKNVYKNDITYGTNNEFGFDYLRDNMARHKDDLVQNTLNTAIVDEVDSILIDEARTPLIISAPDSESTSKYQTYAQLIPQLIENVDYNIDIKQKQASLSEAGIKKMENLLGIGNLFTEAGFQEVHHIEQSLKAQAIMIKDQDYIVKDDQVIIIDEFTGRLMDGRRYSDGLHQSLEAKENVVIQRESKTLATITFQNYFRLYDKLSGMTGTAETEAEEFAKIYGLDTIVIPTNKVMSRQDLTDKIFQNEVGKYKNLIQTVQELSSKGQPILIGTVHIEKSELLSELLTQHKISHEVLNAKNHAREAEIIAKAGQKGAITIATNMAGRGTDIKLGEGVNELGGLAILGTERHESRRIDNQLRGRAGRQGDNGLSQFYVAMNDDLMRRFGGEKLGKMMNNLGISNDEAIENRMISNSVENAQKRIEGFHFDARKHVVQYDDVVNIHREKIYAKRRIFLLSQKVDDEILKIIKSYATKLVQQNLPTEDANYSWNIQELIESLSTLHPLPAEEFSQENLSEERERGVIEKKVINLLLKIWQDKIQQNPTAIQEFAQQIVLQSIDELWLEHLNEMTNLRDRVALSGYAQKDPLMEYKAQAFEMFSNLLENINKIVVENLFRINFQAITSKELDSNVPINVQTNAEEINNQLVNNDLSTKNPEELTRSERRRLERKNKNNQ